MHHTSMYQAHTMISKDDVTRSIKSVNFVR